MRNLSEIIENCKLDKPVDNEDLQYAVIALTTIANMAASTVNHIYKDDAKLSDKLRCENFHKTYNSALNKSPKEWLGWNNDPKNPEYQKFHSWASKIVDKAIKGELPNQKKKER